MRRLLVLVPMLVLAGAAAMADDGLNINWREARVYQLDKPATSVVIGDPTVADVTLDNPKTIIIFGKTPGETNILVLSGEDGLLLDLPVVVSPVSARHVSVMNAQGEAAPSEVLYACGNERCSRVLSPTDVEFSARSSSSTSSDTDATQSSATNESTVNTGVPIQGGGPGPAATDATP